MTMTMYFIIGAPGTGKTLAMTALGYALYLHGAKIYSNYPVSFPHEPVRSPEEILNLIDGVFLADELHKWLDSRASTKEKHSFYSNTLLRARKNRLHIILSAQLKSMVDKRIRENVDYFIKPELKNNACSLAFHEYIGKDRINMIPSFTGRFNAVPVYSLYETHGQLYDERPSEDFIKSRRTRPRSD